LRVIRPKNWKSFAGCRLRSLLRVQNLRRTDVPEECSGKWSAKRSIFHKLSVTITGTPHSGVVSRPTLAFKILAARFMARLMGYFVARQTRPLTVSRHFGRHRRAVATAFLGVPGIPS